ncbi:ABC transporter substrate-binding protein [Nonomuraea sp. PA05]|uniref:ABC transporter substrate-binding protein n=1 Tax=Nonomuraea sp. PA05 TaxID=2604466 RepID=UPI0011DB3149|nr:ABC transporter substrate-binding protein [Nonomuraea sp. PA05]TYB57608.1 ABC transporter substrate-binding protein [Nonomuraea sp. PA05]
MGGIFLNEETRVNAPPGEVFALFGQDAGAGWLFDAAFDALRPGAVVRFRIPWPAGCGGDGTLEATGRIVSVRPGSRMVLAHETPWRGRVVCTLTPDGSGTRVRVVAEIDDSGIAWLLARSGFEPPGPAAEPGSHPVGLLVSLSGSASVFAAASENLARMAVDEANADGGVCGGPLRLVVADDATDARVGATRMRWLVRAGCRAVFTNVTSATFAAIEPIARAAGVLLIYTPVNEGGPAGHGLLRLGERPAGQLSLAVPYLMRDSGGRRWFLAGNDYVWPRASNRQARRIIGAAGGEVAGERYAAIGTRRFEPLVEEIERSRADLVVSTFVGADEALFERACHAAGLRARVRTLSLALDEATREHAGDAAGTGLYTAFGYYQQLPIAANRAFLARYRERYGPVAPPVSSISESVYEAVHLYTAAARGIKGGEPAEIGRALPGSTLQGPRGRIRVAGHDLLEQDLHLVRAVPGGFAHEATAEPKSRRL